MEIISINIDRKLPKIAPESFSGDFWSIFIKIKKWRKKEYNKKFFHTWSAVRHSRETFHRLFSRLFQMFPFANMLLSSKIGIYWYFIL